MGEDYYYWSHNMKVLLKSMKLWNIVDEGFEDPETKDGMTQAQRNALNEKQEKESKALFHIYQAIERSVFERIAKAETSKQAWKILQTAHLGEERAFNGECLEDQKVVEKVLRSRPSRFDFIAATIKEFKDLETLSLDDLLASLKSHELRVKHRNPSLPDQTLKSQILGGFNSNTFRGRGRSGARGRGHHSRGRGRGFQSGGEFKEEVKDDHTAIFEEVEAEDIIKEVEKNS
ncbi:uncharacterized protein LOC111366726 [Olea europaea var. sylvestris]|uniref:uncharacterized protein LOC111366726 n=1 Tax=Olea europaea var. sylvestris TaxID=158386 RepID=UPI000C1D2CE7|nr:uncharacterized protein LOC111366726 [Olea europaea var. sylvestris]